MDGSILRKQRIFFIHLPLLFKRSYEKLVHNDPLRMAGATAFFTSFALPFILIILTQLLGLIINPLRIRKEIFSDLADIFGRQSMRQMVDTLVAFRHLASNIWITVFGSLFLVLVATTLLMVVKSSINQLWRIKVHEGPGFWQVLRTRLQSVIIIIATGVLIVISIVADAARLHVGKSIGEVSPDVAFYFNSILTHIFSLLFITLWFGIIFRLLPDGRPTWRIAFTGAFVTAILFSIGKVILRLLLTSSNIGSLYGTSASVVLILLFVFYSSLILYFGAAFTRVWADHIQQPVIPLPYARRYRVMEMNEEDDTSVG